MSRLIEEREGQMSVNIWLDNNSRANEEKSWVLLPLYLQGTSEQWIEFHNALARVIATAIRINARYERNKYINLHRASFTKSHVKPPNEKRW